MKDKSRKGKVQNVLHEADEGQNRKRKVKNVLHEALKDKLQQETCKMSFSVLFWSFQVRQQPKIS